MMHRMPHGTASGLSSREWISALALLLTLAAPVRADVVVKQKTISEGLGGFGDGTSLSTLTVAGDRSRTDEEFTYTGRLKTLAGRKPRATTSIVRLDREVLWDLEPGKKQYTEMTFAELRARMAAAGEELAKARAEAEAEAGAEGQPARDADLEYTVEVKRTGAKETVNGFASEQSIVTLTARPKHPEPGQEGAAFRITLDLWLSKALPGGPELEAFQRRFATALGQDPNLQRTAAAAMALYGGAVREMAEKLKGLEGYPVRSILVIENLLSEAQKAELQKARAEGAKARAEEKASQQKGEAAESAQDAAELGAAAAGGRDLKGAVGGFFGKKLAKAASKKAEAKAEEAAGATTAPGEGPLFKATTEVLSVSAAGAEPTQFDVPAGYKKVVRER
jgi:hypothetical protein